MLILYRSTSAPNSRVLGHHVSNPVDLIGWAVQIGRIPAADTGLWASWLAGPGADAYSDELLS